MTTLQCIAAVIETQIVAAKVQWVDPSKFSFFVTTDELVKATNTYVAHKLLLIPMSHIC